MTVCVAVCVAKRNAWDGSLTHLCYMSVILLLLTRLCVVGVLVDVFPVSNRARPSCIGIATPWLEP